MKRFSMMVALVCVLSTSVLAGEVPTVGAPAPPPPNGVAAPTNPGDIPSGGKPGDISTSGAPDWLSSDALSALLSVFSFCVR